MRPYRGFRYCLLVEGQWEEEGPQPYVHLYLGMFHKICENANVDEIFYERGES